MIQMFVEMNRDGIISNTIIPLRSNKQIDYMTNNIFKDKIVVVTGASYDIAVTDSMLNLAKDILILDEEEKGVGVFNSIQELKDYLTPLVDTNDILIVGGSTLYENFIDNTDVIYAIKIDEYRNMFGVDVQYFPEFKKNFVLDVVKELPSLIFSGMLLNYEYNKYIRLAPSKLLK